jgi:hypothetical protein
MRVEATIVENSWNPNWSMSYVSDQYINIKKQNKTES